ncbi:MULTISPECIES: hypothetical protein [Pseudomonas]|uniref:hypothetical protein n=1 Tax=Pseudomonas TaxID=286 RepID=UPI001FFFC632|nr:hypothetical protein [Pseudomonas sp. A2]UPK85962.1 hypothetical protein E5221_13720 [Pseudomonas sp. A2]
MKSVNWPRLLLLGLMSASASSVSAGNVALTPGQYEGLMVAITPDHKVEGYFSEELGEGVSRRCAFYLQGQLDDASPMRVTTWSHQAFPGSVAATADGIELRVPKGQEHPGCGSVLGPMISTGLALSRTASKHWIGLATVSAERAYLQKNRGEDGSRGPYIIKGDVVGLLAYQPGWAHVEFTGDDERSHIGWIRQDQINPLKPSDSLR